MLGGLSWCAQQSCPHVAAAISLLLSQVTTSTVHTILEVNKLVYQVKSHKDRKMIIHGGIPLEKTLFAGWADAACQNRKDGKSTQGLFIGLTSMNLLSGELCKVTPVYWASSKIQRQCPSPGASESGGNRLFEMTGSQARVRHTGQQVPQVPAVLVMDSTNVYDKLHTEVYVPKGPERRVSLEMLGLKQGIEETKLQLTWAHRDAQLAKSLTEDNEQHQLNKFYQLGHRWKIVEDPKMKSAKRREKLGLDALDDGDQLPGAGGMTVRVTFVLTASVVDHVLTISCSISTLSHLEIATFHSGLERELVVPSVADFRVCLGGKVELQPYQSASGIHFATPIGDLASFSINDTLFMTFFR